MQIRITIFIVCVLYSSLSHAQLPKRGSLMDSVQAEFGSPVNINNTVGEPPITRWNYETFTVVFEYEHVIHAFPRNNSVEQLSSNNTDGLVIPDTNTEQTETNPEDVATPLNNSFFESTPDLIR